jgi:hypothetical protein
MDDDEWYEHFDDMCRLVLMSQIPKCGTPLSDWAHRQHRANGKGELSSDRFDELAAIGFWVMAPSAL